MGPELSQESRAGTHTSVTERARSFQLSVREDTTWCGGNADREGPRPDRAKCFVATERRARDTRNGSDQSSRRHTGERERGREHVS